MQTKINIKIQNIDALDSTITSCIYDEYKLVNFITICLCYIHEETNLPFKYACWCRFMSDLEICRYQNDNSFNCKILYMLVLQKFLLFSLWLSDILIVLFALFSRYFVVYQPLAVVSTIPDALLICYFRKIKLKQLSWPKG